MLLFSIVQEALTNTARKEKEIRDTNIGKLSLYENVTIAHPKKQENQLNSDSR